MFPWDSPRVKGTKRTGIYIGYVAFGSNSIPTQLSNIEFSRAVNSKLCDFLLHLKEPHVEKKLFISKPVKRFPLFPIVGRSSMLSVSLH